MKLMDMKNLLIQKLGLIPLPSEGGYYTETYRSTIEISADLSGNGVIDKRKAGTCIYYLVTPDDFSALHRVRSDEIFHFYFGDPVEMFLLDEKMSNKIILGSDIFNGHSPQVIVPAGVWQGARLKEGGQFALLGTTVSPGFEFVDFELGLRDELILKFPSERHDILKYTRG